MISIILHFMKCLNIDSTIWRAQRHYSRDYHAGTPKEPAQCTTLTHCISLVISSHLASDQTLSRGSLLSHLLNRSSTVGRKRIWQLAAPSKSASCSNYFLLSLTGPFPLGQASLSHHRTPPQHMMATFIGEKANKKPLTFNLLFRCFDVCHHPWHVYTIPVEVFQEDISVPSSQRASLES